MVILKSSIFIQQPMNSLNNYRHPDIILFYYVLYLVTICLTNNLLNTIYADYMIIYFIIQITCIISQEIFYCITSIANIVEILVLIEHIFDLFVIIIVFADFFQLVLPLSSSYCLIILQHVSQNPIFSVFHSVFAKFLINVIISLNAS